jgi:hypothetical protein
MCDLSPEQLAQLHVWRKAQEPRTDDTWRLQMDIVHVPQVEVLTSESSVHATNQ